MMSAGPVPPRLQPYVRILGEDLAIEFLLAHGGARRQLSASPRPDNAVVAVVGVDLAKALYDEFGMDIPRVPLAKDWIARTWQGRGVPISEIARRLHVADKTVRGWTKTTRTAARDAARERQERREAEKARQGDLLDWLEAGRTTGRSMV